jgi:hypothetical protein
LIGVNLPPTMRAERPGGGTLARSAAPQRLLRCSNRAVSDVGRAMSDTIAVVASTAQAVAASLGVVDARTHEPARDADAHGGAR